MTPTRRKALQWIREREPVGAFDASGPGPGLQFVWRLVKEGDVERAGKEGGAGFFAFTLFRLTEQGNAKLGPKPLPDIGRDAVDHLRTAYPAALAAVPKTAAISLRNFINNRVQALLAERNER